jgi:hypothetical protein
MTRAAACADMLPMLCLLRGPTHPQHPISVRAEIFRDKAGCISFNTPVHVAKGSTMHATGYKHIATSAILNPWP